ncbi:MAG: DUF1284 domain-containing protein [Planctomycetaceae bacterium]|nr:MAG: DUF1284 domain-containing protein [Planctomycetaceae bacterium]
MNFEKEAQNINTTSNIIEIRAHHLLCLQGFQGHGYDEAFAQNMSEIVRYIDLNPDLEIEIVTKCDVICACCPNNVKGICKNLGSAQSIREMDLYVLRKLGLKRGTKIRAKGIFTFVNTKLSNSLDIENLCGVCEWREKCLWPTLQDR